MFLWDLTAFQNLKDLRTDSLSLKSAAMLSETDVDYVAQMLSTARDANEAIMSQRIAPTFDLDLMEEDFVDQTRKGLVVKDKRDLDGVAVFQARMSYHLKKREEESKVVKKSTTKADIVCDANEIDAFDQKTPWRKMDTWMKKQKLKEFAIRLAEQCGRQTDEVTQLLLTIYKEGKLRKSSLVTYDQETGQITNIDLPAINELTL